MRFEWTASATKHYPRPVAVEVITSDRAPRWGKSNKGWPCQVWTADSALAAAHDGLEGTVRILVKGHQQSDDVLLVFHCDRIRRGKG